MVPPAGIEPAAPGLGNLTGIFCKCLGIPVNTLYTKVLSQFLLIYSSIAFYCFRYIRFTIFSRCGIQSEFLYEFPRCDNLQTKG